MLKPEGVEDFVTFTTLGGREVSHDEVRNELARWPLDGVLGYLGKISLELAKAGHDFSDPRRQGPHLNLAIVDDFPVRLPRAGTMYAPGRVPYTGGQHLFIHEGNLAWLSHSALLHSPEVPVTEELSLELRRRMCRLLLIANDLSSPHLSPGPRTLVARRNVALEWLRHWRFNTHFQDLPEALQGLARQHRLMLEFLPHHFFDVEEAFMEASNGIPLQTYFEIVALLVTNIYAGFSRDAQWLQKSRLCVDVEACRDQIEHVLWGWMTTPEEYKSACANRGMSLESAASHDYAVLWERPLIEARPRGRPGDVVCPVMPFLLAKAEEPYYTLSAHLEQEGRRVKFQQALGMAYEDYAHSLVERIASADNGGAWTVVRKPPCDDGEEFADSYLQRGDVGVCFEHKAGRVGLDFLRGGPGDRVLGPPESVLTRLDNGGQVTLSEGRQADEGFLTRGMWQQSNAGEQLLAWAEGRIGARPKRLFPVITHQSEFRVDQVCRVSYLQPLICRAGLYRDSFWEQPQWLHVTDLEGLASVAEAGRLDLGRLLTEKAARHRDMRFDWFLMKVRQLGRYMADRQLNDLAVEILKSARARFGGGGDA